MTSRRFSWRWVMFGAVPIVVAGLAVTATADTQASRSLGVGIFAAGAGIYIAARVAMILEGRR